MGKEKRSWWHGGALYQIYPRSFNDTSGNGVGDLRGIHDKLDYIKSLGVQGLWISPFFKSPMVDFGYDVSDYKTVDPLFGNNEDFLNLLKSAHEKNLKVIVDLVLSHTSEEHHWFQESVKDPEGPYGDYYVWYEGEKEPNNWLSVFGGKAWSYHPERKAWYFHNFLKEQPDLNLHNPKVQEELLGIAKFWLDHGVDGFRLDACNCYFHDPSLRDNPQGPVSEVKVQDESNPYFRQVHLYDKSQAENGDFLHKLRDLVDQYEERILLGEIFCDREEETTRLYAGGGKPLHSAYNFSLLTNERPPGLMRDAVMTYFTISEATAWSFSNHDVVRVASRWGDGLAIETRAKAYNTLLSGLPGLLIFYQGEELGLTEAVLPKNYQFDPFGSNIDSPYPGRDGCRTPMPWSEKDKNFGFSEGTPWLPLPKEHGPMSVSSQVDRKESCLNHLRRLGEYRKSSEVLKKGSIHFWEDDGDCIVYNRKYEGRSVVIMANFGQKPLRWSGLPEGHVKEALSENIEFKKDESGCVLEILPGGFGVVELDG